MATPPPSLFDLVRGFSGNRIVIELLNEIAIEGTLAIFDKPSILLLKDAIVYNCRVNSAVLVKIEHCYIRSAQIRFVHFARFQEIFDHFKTSMKKIGNFVDSLILLF
jgi:small nuclear ribonucleoprotein (snRNP)-like protein